MGIFIDMMAIYFAVLVVAAVILWSIVRINKDDPFSEDECWKAVNEWSRHEYSL